MRITESILTRSFLNSLNNTMRDLYISSNKLSSGKKLQTPSDSPSETQIICDYKLNEKSLNQFIKNIEYIISRYELYDSCIDSIYNEIANIKEKISRSGASNSSEIKNNLVEEINLTIKNIVFTLNRRDSTSYIFSGTDGLKKPFEIVTETQSDGSQKIVSVEYKGNNLKNKIHISDNEYEIFGFTGNEIVNYNYGNIFDILINLREDLMRGYDISVYQDKLNEYFNHLNKIIVNNGSRINNLNLKIELIKKEILNTQSSISDIEDIDYSQEIVKYTSIKNRYEIIMRLIENMQNNNISNYL
ncbi:MAG: hypothetical protein N2446_02000 [Elusimicrobiales bacterium]|nr:hypothetical protein [Elusimicrobiales bacterium]